MTVVNTTFLIENPLTVTVLEWIENSYRRSALHAGAIDSHTMLARVVTDDAVSTTYALHMAFPDMETAVKWADGVSDSLLGILSDRWRERVLAFKTLLDVL